MTSPPARWRHAPARGEPEARGKLMRPAGPEMGENRRRAPAQIDQGVRSAVVVLVLGVLMYDVARAGRVPARRRTPGRGVYFARYKCRRHRAAMRAATAAGARTFAPPPLAPSRN